MLTTLSSLKTRLAIPDTSVSDDDMLTFIIEAVSARFDQETNRTLARTENATFEFDATDLEISVPCYPIESIAKFETKNNPPSGISAATWSASTPSGPAAAPCNVSRNWIFSCPSHVSFKPTNVSPYECTLAFWSLKFASWNFSGVWSLVLDVFPFLPFQTILKRHTRWAV